MKQPNLISPIFKILLLYEDVIDTESDVELEDYLTYLDRIGLRYLGIEQHEVYQSIKGLKALGLEATHKQVKSVVFHMIRVLGGNKHGV